MRIITISREFGSGGRELGKRLADALGVPCYDHEIIDMVAEQHGFDKNYVAHISEKDIRVFYPSTIAHRFMSHQPAAQQPIKIAVAEHEMLRKMKKIDKERAAYRGLFTEEEWGRKESYHLCVNTSGREIKSLIPALASYINTWFVKE